MDSKKYESLALRTKERRSSDKTLIKLNEEVGEVNKAYIKPKHSKEELEEECCDLLYRFTRFLDKQGSSLSKIMEMSAKKHGGTSNKNKKGKRGSK